MKNLNLGPISMVILSAALTACGGGGGGGSSSSNNGPTTGDLSVAITDAPVDGVVDVIVEFDGVILKAEDDDAQCVPEDYVEERAELVRRRDEVETEIEALEDELETETDPMEIERIEDEIDELQDELADIQRDIDAIDDGTYEGEDETECEKKGGQLHYTFSEPRTINLKELVDGKIELLFDDEVPSGRYNWMKLQVNAQFDGVFDSYVVDDQGGQIELRVPPDRLKLGNGFTVPEGGTSRFVIDWNLRMGLTNPVGQPGYKLQPSLRITDMVEYGSIEGTVADSLLPPLNEDCSSDMNDEDGNVVYVFEGSDVVPDDIDGIDPDPLTTADVRLDGDSGTYTYMVPFLPPGPYTVAFTCQAADDVVTDPELPDDSVDNDLVFTEGQNATVVDDTVTIVDF